MLESLAVYSLFCYMLVRFKIVKGNTKNYIIMGAIGLSAVLLLFMVSRYYAFIDLTKSATVKASQISFRTPAGGEIIKVYVRHNQEVKKGDIIFTIDTYRYDIQMTSLKSDLQAQQTTYETIKKDLSRLERLKRGGFVSDSELENKRAALFSQKKLVSSVQQQIDDLLWKIGKATIIAPEAGVVNIIYLSDGQYLPENRISSITLFTKRKFLEVRIPDQVYSYITVGAFSEFFVNAYPGKIFRGRVQSISKSTGEAQGPMSALRPQNVSQLVRQGSEGIGRTVIIEFVEPEEVDIPVGSNGQAWITAEKESEILALVDILAGMILRAAAVESYLGALF